MSAGALAAAAPGWRAALSVRRTVWSPSIAAGRLYPQADVDMLGEWSPLLLLAAASAIAGFAQAATAVTGDPRFVWLDLAFAAPLAAVAISALQSHITDVEAATTRLMCTTLMAVVWTAAAVDGTRATRAMLPVAAAAWGLQLLQVVGGEVARPSALPAWAWVAVGLQQAGLIGTATLAASCGGARTERAAALSVITKVPLACLMVTATCDAGVPHTLQSHGAAVLAAPLLLLGLLAIAWPYK